MSFSVGAGTTTRDSSVAMASSVTHLPVRMGGAVSRGHPASYVTAPQDLQVRTVTSKEIIKTELKLNFFCISFCKIHISCFCFYML